jgi:hypothetical protein
MIKLIFLFFIILSIKQLEQRKFIGLGIYDIKPNCLGKFYSMFPVGYHAYENECFHPDLSNNSDSFRIENSNIILKRCSEKNCKGRCQDIESTPINYCRNEQGIQYGSIIVDEDKFNGPRMIFYNSNNCEGDIRFRGGFQNGNLIMIK